MKRCKRYLHPRGRTQPPYSKSHIESRASSEIAVSQGVVSRSLPLKHLQLQRATPLFYLLNQDLKMPRGRKSQMQREEGRAKQQKKKLEEKQKKKDEAEEKLQEEPKWPGGAAGGAQADAKVFKPANLCFSIGEKPPPTSPAGIPAKPAENSVVPQINFKGTLQTAALDLRRDTGGVLKWGNA